MELTVRTSAVGEYVVVTVGGEVDVVTAPTLRQHIAEVIEQGDSLLVADLTNVPFLDSTGLGALVGRLKAVRQLGGDLRLVITSERVLRNFRITGLDKVFRIFPTVEEATADAP